ncbi:RlmE family RNA methyltransferase [Tistrella bauzanensis]|uniref:Ribosomal RNA large subunit methyltransferase E n=1 Tax=Tistrella arctica TaxID=3133430 RepID=A0ABU9YE78_9PROT
MTTGKSGRGGRSGAGGGAGRGGGRGGDPIAGQRIVKQRVRTNSKRTASSARWLERQLNDPYVAAAKREGYRSRAAFKIIQLDEKYGLLRPGQRVVDLGAAPGGWTQIAVDRTRAGRAGGGRVVGIDILPVEPIEHATLIELDFLDPTAPDVLKQALGGPADVVLSDMAPPTSGHQQVDHLRIMHLLEIGLDFATEVLSEDGAFVAKVFRGGAEGELVKRMQRLFRTVRHMKPPSSRAESSEMYVVAQGFRTEAAAAERARVQSGEEHRMRPDATD